MKASFIALILIMTSPAVAQEVSQTRHLFFNDSRGQVDKGQVTKVTIGPAVRNQTFYYVIRVYAGSNVCEQWISNTGSALQDANILFGSIEKSTAVVCLDRRGTENISAETMAGEIALEKAFRN